MCNSGTWKIPVLPGAPLRSFQRGTARPVKFAVGNHTGFFLEKSREKSGKSYHVREDHLRYHVREGHLQYLQKLQADLADKDSLSEEVLPRQSKNGWQETIRIPANLAFDILFCRLFFLDEKKTSEPDCKWMLYKMSYMMSYTTLYIMLAVLNLSQTLLLCRL